MRPYAARGLSLLILGWLLTGIIPETVQAQSAPPDTLVLASYSDLFEAVAQNNQNLVASTSAAEAQAALVAAVGNLPDPVVIAGVSPFPVHTARGEQVFQLRVEQMLPWPGKRSLKRQMAELDAALGKEASSGILSDLTFDAIHAGLAIHHVDATIAQVASFRQRLERFEQVAITRYETGEGEQQSIWKLQLAIAAQDQRLLQLGEDREAAIRRVEQVVHHPVRIAPGAFLRMLPWSGKAMSHASAYRTLEQTLERYRLSRR